MNNYGDILAKQQQDKPESSNQESDTTNRISEFISRTCKRMEGAEEQRLSDLVLDLAQAKLSRFPGAHPTSLTHENIQEVFTSNRYYVTSKSDGVRYVSISPFSILSILSILSVPNLFVKQVSCTDYE
jgi:hypothetical protein